MVDQLHQELLLQIRGLLESKAKDQSQSELASAVSEMIGILKAHFSAEERIGSHNEDSVFFSAHHASHHQAYLEKIKSYERDLAAGAAVYSLTMLSILARDLISHIQFEANLLKGEAGESKSAGYDFFGKHILAVDDEEELRHIIKEELEERGAKVKLAGGGNEAILLFKAHTFDFVLTDIKMPDGDGLELLRHIRALDPTRPPVALISAHFPHPEEHLLSMGAQALLTKPVKFDHLVTQLLTLM